MASTNRRVGADVGSARCWEQMFLDEFFSPAEAAVLRHELRRTWDGRKAGGASAVFAAEAVAAGAEAGISPEAVAVALSDAGTLPPRIGAAWRKQERHQLRGGALPVAAAAEVARLRALTRFVARLQRQLAYTMLRDGDALVFAIRSALALMPALDGLAAGPASRLGLREDERSAWVGLVRRLAAHPDLLSAAEMLKDDTVMASRARARLGEMVCTDPGVAWRAEAFAGVAAEWVRDLGPALPGLRWEGVVGVPDADALDAAALRANGDTAQLVGITARCLGELDCWTRDEERHGLHAVAQRSEEAYWALANNPSRDAAAAIRKAVLGTGGARERDRLLRQCLVELGDVHPHPFRALGCAVAAASDAWRAELGSRSAAGAEHSECLDVSRWLVTVVGFIGAATSTLSSAWSHPWGLMCVSRVTQAFPLGSFPAEAARWLCALDLEPASAEEALGFSCSSRLPEAPVPLSWSTEFFAVDPAKLSKAVCGGAASVSEASSPRMLQAHFEQGKTLAVALVCMTLLPGAAMLACRAWAALTSLVCRRPSPFAFATQVALETSPFCASLGGPEPWRVLPSGLPTLAWLSQLGSSVAVGALIFISQRNDDVGICAGMAAAVSLASMALALATVCRRTRDAGDGASHASLAGMGIRLRPWFSAALLAVQALCFVCLSGMLLECWGSTVLGQQRAGPDLSLVHELDCGGWWMEWLRTGACVWIVMFAVFAVALAALSLPTQGGTLCCATISQADAMELIGLAIAVGSVVLSQLPRLMAVDLSRHEGDSSDFEVFCLLPTLLAGGGWCLGFGVLSPSIDILVSWGWMGDATKWGAGRRGFVSAHVARDALRRITSGAPRRHVRTAAVAASHATLPGAAD